MKDKRLIISHHSIPSFYMIFVKGDIFNMGGKSPQADELEKPMHKVKLSDFYLGKYLVTQLLWKVVMSTESPSNFKGDLRPVENVSWEDTHVFIEKLNGFTRYAFRLPTEAEWEFAARGGIYSEGYLYAGSGELDQVGWCRENSVVKTKEVCQLLPNELGIHDMSGNVREWCEGDWHEDYKGAPDDGSAWIDSPERRTYRVNRGGRSLLDAEICRSAYRSFSSPGLRHNSVGFRLALPSSQLVSHLSFPANL